jgi:hypothetical protein
MGCSSPAEVAGKREFLHSRPLRLLSPHGIPRAFDAMVLTITRYYTDWLPMSKPLVLPPFGGCILDPVLPSVAIHLVEQFGLIKCQVNSGIVADKRWW